MVMPEYGRHIQEMVDYVRTIEDPVVRQKNADSIIELMGVLNPHLSNVEDFKHKLWDHLFTIAEFDLDVVSPYPIPSRESLVKKPVAIPYPRVGKNHRHLGKNILILIAKAKAEPDPEKKEAFTKVIAYYMKLAYNNWHKEVVHDEMIQNEIDVLSGGELTYNIGDVRIKFNNNPNRTRNTGTSNNRNNNRNNNNPNNPNNRNPNNRNNNRNNNPNNHAAGGSSANGNNWSNTNRNNQNKKKTF